MKRIKQVSKEAYLRGKEWEWGEFECCHGYGVFNGDCPTEYGLIEADHIEVIGDMDAWDDAEAAASHAERYCKMKIIRDIPGLPHLFLDNEQNRASILRQIAEANNQDNYFI